MSDATAADEMIARALPMTHEAWRSKQIKDMTPHERRLALADAVEAHRSSKEGYNNPPADWDRDDVIWAYEAFKRAERRIRDIKDFESDESRRFDVV